MLAGLHYARTPSQTSRKRWLVSHRCSDLKRFLAAGAPSPRGTEAAAAAAKSSASDLHLRCFSPPPESQNCQPVFCCSESPRPPSRRRHREHGCSCQYGAQRLNPTPSEGRVRPTRAEGPRAALEGARDHGDEELSLSPTKSRKFPR